MAGISVPGLGSGLDINGLVQQLITAEGEPARRRLDVREAGFQARISAYGSLKSALAEFRAAQAGVAEASTFDARRVVSSNPSVVNATADTGAASGTYSLQVTSLAQAQTLASEAFAAADTVVGSGTLTFSFGTFDADASTFSANPAAAGGSVEIDASNNTVQGIRDAVNAADLGVEARIVNDGSGERLLFGSTETGAARSLRIEVSGDGEGSDTDLLGLSRLAFDATAGAGVGRNLAETTAARDAQFSIDGLNVTRASNTVTGVIEGVTLTLRAPTADAPVAVTVSRDEASLRGAVGDFVAGFNTLVQTFQGLASFDAESGQAGILLGDSLLRGIERTVRAELSGVVDGLGQAPLRSLADIGISTSEAGTLVLDEARLAAVSSASPGALAGLFTAAGSVSDTGLRFVQAGASSAAGRYDIEVTQLASRGSYAAAALGSLTVDADNDTFSLVVDGVQSGSIALTQRSYASGAELATELQTRINADATLQAAGAAVSVSFDGTALTITSDRFGSSSGVQVSAADTGSAATLGIGTATGSSNAGLDVAGRFNGAVASGNGRLLSDASGLTVEVTGGGTGSRGSLTFSRGVTVGLDALLASYLDGDAALDASIEGLQSRVATIGAEREALQARLEVREARLRSQFSALDGLLAQLQSTSDFLAQQLAALPGSRSGGNRS